MRRSTVFYSVSCKQYRAAGLDVSGTPGVLMHVESSTLGATGRSLCVFSRVAEGAQGTMVDVSLFGRRGKGSGEQGPFGNTDPQAVRTPLLTIDALGRKCPIPIIMLAEQIRDVPVGQVVAVRADDPAAYTDIPSWCGLKSHELVYRDALDSGWEFGIRRHY